MERDLDSSCFLVGLGFFGVFGNLVILMGFCVAALWGAFSMLPCHLRLPLRSFLLVTEVTSALHVQSFPHLAPGEALRPCEHLSEGPTAGTHDAAGRSGTKLPVQNAH